MISERCLYHLQHVNPLRKRACFSDVKERLRTAVACIRVPYKKGASTCNSSMAEEAVELWQASLGGRSGGGGSKLNQVDVVDGFVGKLPRFR